MNFLILGDGPEEKSWVKALAGSIDTRIVAYYPRFLELEDSGVEPARDLDDALATAGVDAAMIGGESEFRAEALRRVAAEGLPAVCLHPPGADSEAYYQVAMSRAETGAVLVPDLAARLHPGVIALSDAFASGFLGEIRNVKYEATQKQADGDLVRDVFASAIDVVRSVVGEITAVNATGDPIGDRPETELVVQLRGPQSRRAEVRLTTGLPTAPKLSVMGTQGSAVLEFGSELSSPSRLVLNQGEGRETIREFGEWDPKAEILGVLSNAIAGRTVHPDLDDGTRAMEISEAVARSLRRGRTVDLHYEEISEQGTFKSVMTSIGCLLLLSILGVLPIALAGPALGFKGTIYLAYLIPPVLVGFIVMQLLRYATKGPAEPPKGLENGAD